MLDMFRISQADIIYIPYYYTVFFTIFLNEAFVNIVPVITFSMEIN